jgi:hypothetical protein
MPIHVQAISPMYLEAIIWDYYKHEDISLRTFVTQNFYITYIDWQSEPGFIDEEQEYLAFSIYPQLLKP